MMRFDGSVAVITGGCSGIGREIGMGLLREGAKVCLVDKGAQHLTAENPFPDIGRERVRCYAVDITRDDELRDMKRDLLGEYGRIDILVHSAGVFSRGAWESMSMEEVDLLYRTNFRAPVLLTQALLPELKERRGQIVFINSSAVRAARRDVGAYTAMKHALKAFADSLREEVNPAGIRVISIYPGRTATPMQARVCKLEGREYFPERFLRAAEVAEAVVHAMAMPRSAEMTDLHIRPMATGV